MKDYFIKGEAKMVEKHEIFTTGNQDKFRVIFPTPQSEEYPDGEYVLENSYDTKTLFSFYQFVKNGTDDIKTVKNSDFGKEEYEIFVDENGIKIIYSTDEGLFRAITSVRQLIVYGEGKTVPFAKIHDKPQFQYRGYEICRTKNRMTLKYLKRVADFLSELKYNKIELWMENTPKGFVYDKFPMITPSVDDLTAEDMHEFDEYCRERYIDVILDTNCFGHLYKWFDIEEYKDLEIRDEKTRTGSLNIMDPRSRDFIEKLFDSYIPHTKADIVSIGLDEAFGLGKFQLEEVCKEKGREQVFVDFVNEMTEYTRKRYGKNVFVCTDMFNDMENPEYYLKQFPKGAITREWGYEEISNYLVADNCRMKKDNGFEFVMVACTGTWAAFAGRFDNAVNNMRAYAEIGQKYNAYGYTISIWNCESYAWELVPTAIGAQYAWNVGHKQHGGWTKGYYVRNAQDYIDKYVFGGAKVSRDICRLANTYLLEPEYVVCGTILKQMIWYPLNDKVKKDFYDVRELYEEFHIDNIIEYVQKLIKRISAVDFPEIYKREILADANMIILAAEYMRIRITDKVTKEKAEEMKALSKWLLEEYAAFKAEQGYRDTEHLLDFPIKKRLAEIDEYIK